VSADQLRRPSLEGHAADVQALLDAGVSVNGGAGLNDSPLYVAVFSGCGAKGGETDDLVSTVGILLKGGADVKRKDDNGNAILTSAAQMCGGKIVSSLIAAGADMNVTNGSGITPLGMAFMMHKADAAEALVAGGARLNATQAQMVTAMVTDPREKALLQRATRK
jgi:ankyrin repeat protein